MRTILGFATPILFVPALLAGAAQAQPAGSYRSQCTDIRMNGQFLSATCRGSQGGGQSSINVASCASDIYVDASGALTCRGPGAVGRPGGPAYPAPQPPAVRPPPQGGGYGREQAVLFAARDWRGQSVRIDGPVSNLARFGINDRVRSIQLGRRSGAWQVCTDANYRGQCRTIRSSVSDARRIGLDGISSLRPTR